MKRPSVRTKMFLNILKKAKHGRVHATFPDGRQEVYGDGEPVIHVEVKDWSAIDLLFSKGDLGLAESVVEGTLIVDDMARLVEWACLNDQDLARALHGTWYGTLAAQLRHFLNRKDREGARKNIMSHYDLGNEFYRLWLDSSMTYSSAIFEKPEQELVAAQTAKYDRIIDALEIKSGDHVLEIGCGWGGFFSRAVQRTGCKVTAVMKTAEQARHTQQKIEQQNFKDHVNLLQVDYRDITGKFDKVVSIEMIESVGEKYWNAFFGKVGASLKSRGSALIQGITIRDDLFYSYRKSTDFIQQYVFPGGMLLTNNIFRQKGQEHGMNLGQTYEFGLHYADTLKTWRHNFNKALPDIQAMGFDDKFIRLWNLYLSYCEGAFRAGRISVGQYLLET
jgi:cyclopropane-fatty-acyl-phospholipid synthase